MAEVLTIQIRHSAGDSWETTGRLAVYRTGDGNYSQLPERQPAKEIQEQKASDNISDEGNIFS
jgi:hypothetical protein